MLVSENQKLERDYQRFEKRRKLEKAIKVGLGTRRGGGGAGGGGLELRKQGGGGSVLAELAALTRTGGT
jgi:hypothetical protein